MSVHHRLRLLAFPMRTRSATCLWSDVGSPGSRARNFRTCQCLRPRRAVWALAISRLAVLLSVNGTTSAPEMSPLSRLNGWPMRSPVNASLMPSRAAAHDSGSMRFATPSSLWTCTIYSLPVSRRTPLLDQSGQSSISAGGGLSAYDPSATMQNDSGHSRHRNNLSVGQFHIRPSISGPIMGSMAFGCCALLRR